MDIQVSLLYRRLKSAHNLASVNRCVFFFLCFVDSVSLQISPTTCIILLNICICFSSLHVSGIMCPSSGENYCIFGTLVFVTPYWWRLVCWLEWNSNQQTRRHPYGVTNTSVANNSNFLLMMGTWMPETCRQEK